MTTTLRDASCDEHMAWRCCWWLHFDFPTGGGVDVMIFPVGCFSGVERRQRDEEAECVKYVVDMMD